MPFHPHLLVLSVFLASLAGTWGALCYARKRQLLDFPGRRRSHQVVTPRGGGAGIVAVLLLALPWLGWRHACETWVLAGGLAAVGGIGWLDDHHPLPARWRFGIHVVVALTCAVALVPAMDGRVITTAVMLGLATFWLAGCINAWNFMDGSNGLVTTQSLWLGLAMVFVFVRIALEGVPAAVPWIGVSLVLAAACGGFLPFNFPRARIFLGDVGSGALGLVCGVLLLAAAVLAPNGIWLLLLLPSALLVDAGLTLALRVLSGRHWYTAHREHLYQWLIRSGASHTQVALLYLGWNLLVVVPVCLAMMRWPEKAPGMALMTLALAAGVWWYGKGALRRRMRRKGRIR